MKLANNLVKAAGFKSISDSSYIKKSDINDLDLKKLRIDLINNKKDELFNLYSQSLLSKLKNTTLIEYLDG